MSDGKKSLEDPLNPTEENLNAPIDQKQDNNDKGENKKGMNESDKKLGGYPPLITILRLSVGPLLSQVTNALFGMIITIWVSKALGEEGVSAVSTMNAFDNMGRSFGFFLAIAASTQISFLYGKKQGEEAGQIIADLIRMSFVCGAIVAACLIPSTKPAAKWFGANEYIADLGFKYMLPLNIFAFNSCMFIMSGGCLQGEGRTFLFGISNMFCLIINMVGFCPLFLFVFKMGMTGVSVATVVSEFIPTIIVLTLFYCHKFSVKPHLKQLFMKFSPHTLPALKVGISSLISQLSVLFPSIIMRKFIGMAVGDEYANAMAGFNAGVRISNLTFAVFQAFSQAFIPPASYAYAAKMYKRYLRLCIHSFWLNFAWGTFTFIFTWSMPRTLSKMFSTNPEYLKWAEKMVAYNNALGPIQGVKMISQSILQSLQLGGRASILSFINNFVIIILAAVVIYYTNKDHGERIVLSYPVSHLCACFISAIFLWGPLKKLYKEARENEGINDLELKEITNQSKSDKNDETETKEDEQAASEYSLTLKEISELNRENIIEDDAFIDRPDDDSQV